MTPSSSPSRSAGTRAGIGRHDVAEAALRLVEAGGPDALTMRKLAAELGVTTTTIYWHVGNRGELITAVVELLGSRVAAATVSGATATERVMSAAMNVWDSALAHPQVTALAYQHGATALLELQLEITLARELTAAGVTGDEARDALRSILICVGGFLVLALRDESVIPVERATTALWAGVDDPLVAPETRAALTRPIDLEAVLRTTLDTVVRHHVG